MYVVLGDGARLSERARTHNAIVNSNSLRAQCVCYARALVVRLRCVAHIAQIGLRAVVVAYIVIALNIYAIFVLRAPKTNAAHKKSHKQLI